MRPETTRYTQPSGWNPNADYKNYLENEVLDAEIKKQSERIRSRFQRIDKLGEAGAAELLLKLASFLNQGS